MTGTPQPGCFIAFEGGEGTGKSTQCKMLAEAWSAQGIEAVVTREPGGTPGAEAIRHLLLHPPGDGWGAKAEALLFAAARSDHVEQLIKPTMARGAWVICDRFVDSSRAYQGGAGGLGDDAIRALHEFGSGGVRPTLTILLEVSEDQLTARLDARDGGASDAIGGRDAEYHRKVAATFRELAAGDPAGFAVLSGEGAPEQVHERVMQALAPLLEEVRA